MDDSKTLYIVIPCYNEEEVLMEITNQLKKKITNLIKNKKISVNSKVLYVNDGSKDKTWEIIKKISKKDNLFTGISLAKNSGHQNALLAGLLVSKNYADMVISMDADLQDDIDAIDEMIEKYYAGCDIVYGVRKSRKSDSLFKKHTAQLFYKIMISKGVDIVYNHADYRLTSKRVLDNLEDFKETNLFLRGIFPLIGYNSDIVYYERKKRYAGKTKYPVKKMMDFAWNGITSFSVKPIQMIRNLGIIILLGSIIFLLWLIIETILGKTYNIGIYLMGSIWLLGGIQILSLGIVGEYIGKISDEVKNRPRYIIDENLINTGDSKNEN